MKIGSKTVLRGLPKHVAVFRPSAGFCDGRFVRFPRRLLAAGRVAAIRLPAVRRLLALERYMRWWVRPWFGCTERDLPSEVQFLLWQRADGFYGLLLPLIDGDLRAFLCGGEEGLELRWSGSLPGKLEREATLLFVAIGSDPHELSQRAVHTVAEQLRSFRVRWEKRMPAWVEYLGWCTWDAFYGKVDAKKVLAGLESFRRGGLVPRFVLLDDGWQDIRERRLHSFAADTKKFPRGLKGLIDRAKERYGVCCFGVWHTLQGYWHGVDPAGPLARCYKLLRNTTAPEGRPGEKPVELYFVHPDDVHRFYQHWHAYLRQQGVDMVKVDNQSSMEVFTEGVLGRVRAMQAYQHALQGAAQTHLEGNLLHCMCNGSDVAYNMQSSLLWRNSDDFWPKVASSHQFHVHCNAMNNLWSGGFALPDWDMFQSGHVAGEFHAAARAISGGPVYVSDKPGKQDFALLRKLCTSDGRILRCERPALPAVDCLFVDCYRQPKLLKITNRNGPVGVMGLFHCRWDSDDPIEDVFSPADVPQLRGRRFATYMHRGERLLLLGRGGRRKISLPKMGFELLTFSPVVGGVAPLGLLEKFNGSRALEGFGFREDGSFEATLRDGGRIGFYCRRPPRKILANGRQVGGKYDRDSGLLVVSRPAGRPVRVVLRF